MTADHLFMRAEQAINESLLLRDERRLIQHQFSDTRKELRLAILALARLRAEVVRERNSRASMEGLKVQSLSRRRGAAPF